MIIKDHKIQGVKYDEANHVKGVMTPVAIVDHYTAGYNAASAAHVFKTTVVAAHVIIDRNGSITQMVPFNRICNHAGPSKYKELSMLNNHAIGIEFVNIGFLKKQGGNYIDAYKGVYPRDTSSLVAAKHSRVGSETYYWEPYTSEQLRVGEELTAALLQTYPSIKYIVSHEEIDTRGWKTDPGPAFPLDKFKGMLNTTPNLKALVKAKATQSLNVRKGPGTSFDKATNFPLFPGQVIEIVSELDNSWVEILINGCTLGFVNGAYLSKV
jgi:N-acetylmuramoyl-L-alanine amidase